MHNHLPARIACFAALAGSVACGQLPDPQALATEVVAHLQTGDFDGYFSKTVATFPEYSAVCPAVTATDYAPDQDSFRTHFEECREQITDWGQAKITDVKPTTGLTPRCGDAVDYASATEVTVGTSIPDPSTGSSTGETYTFRMLKAVKTRNGWKSTEPLDCPQK